MKKDKGLLVVISGPSGAGKGTICKELIKRNSDLWISVSATTRMPREGEVEGKSYFFTSKEEFVNGIGEGNFFEHAEVYGNHYGTPKDKVFQRLDEGIDVVLEIDIQGALKVKEVYPQGVFIFILPPSMDELKKRIIGRGSETPESLMTRFTSAYEELNFVSRYNYAVINDDVMLATEKIEHILVAEKCRVDRLGDSIINKICQEEPK